MFVQLEHLADALAQMRRLVGSMLASFPLAYRSSYVAAKAALRGFADAAPSACVRARGMRPSSTPCSGRSTPTRPAASLPNGSRRPCCGRFRPATRAPYAVGSNTPVVFPLRRLLPHSAVLRLVSRKHGL